MDWVLSSMTADLIGRGEGVQTKCQEFRVEKLWDDGDKG